MGDKQPPDECVKMAEGWGEGILSRVAIASLSHLLARVACRALEEVKSEVDGKVRFTARCQTVTLEACLDVIASRAAAYSAGERDG